MFDFAAAVDTKDPDLGNASGTAINFRYMDLDADCDSLGTELKDLNINNIQILSGDKQTIVSNLAELYFSQAIGHSSQLYGLLSTTKCGSV